MKIGKLLITICLGIASIVCIAFYHNDYVKNCCREVNGIVYAKYETQKKISRSTSYATQFLIVVKDKDTGKCFDISVTPVRYATHNVGDDIHFDLLEKETIGEECNSKVGLLMLSILTMIGAFIMFVVWLDSVIFYFN